MKKVLLIVDPQRDFMDDGKLPVEGSAERMRNLSSYLSTLPYEEYDHIIVTLDWHPINHCSFKENGGDWPLHCVEFTDGALVMQPLLMNLQQWAKQGKLTTVIKGNNPKKEEYSIVQNFHSFSKILPILENAEEIDVCGVVGTVCVKNTINDLIGTFKDRLKVILKFTAQFDSDAEIAFVEFLKSNGIKFE